MLAVPGSLTAGLLALYSLAKFLLSVVKALKVDVDVVCALFAAFVAAVAAVTAAALAASAAAQAASAAASC